jgi:hypothetical protein
MVLAVEKLFKEGIEFDSKNQLLKTLGGNIRMPVLNAILKQLQRKNKIMNNNDGTWTWVYVSDNKKLKKIYHESIKF